MAAQMLSDAVIDLLADDRGIARDAIDPSDRLREDLGMTEGEARIFFNQVHDRFGTDLRLLNRNWIDHFEPRLAAGCGVFYALASLLLALDVAGGSGYVRIVGGVVPSRAKSGQAPGADHHRGGVGRGRGWGLGARTARRWQRAPSSR